MAEGTPSWSMVRGVDKADDKSDGGDNKDKCGDTGEAGVCGMIRRPESRAQTPAYSKLCLYKLFAPDMRHVTYHEIRAKSCEFVFRSISSPPRAFTISATPFMWVLNALGSPDII